MRITIGIRLFLALTLVSLVIITLSATLTRLSFEQGFLTYIAEQEAATIADAAEELADLYWREGSFDSLRNNPRRWNDLLRRGVGEPPAPGRRGPPGPRPGTPPPDPLELGRRIALQDADGMRVIGPAVDVPGSRRVSIDVDGETVGFVVVSPGRQLSNPLDKAFAASQQRAIYVVAAAALFIAAVISALVARQLTRPIRAVASGAQRISDGAFDTRIPTDRNDELGDLARDFNQLAKTLEHNRSSRQRWVADIAHELRTPLAILRGELDALEDGVRTFDAATRRSLQAEVARLTKLVDDLHELSVYDEGVPDKAFVTVDLAALLARRLEASANRFQDAGIRLDADLPDRPVDVVGDPTRLEQLVTNLLENSLRYTDSPGTLQVTMTTSDSSTELMFSDSAPGVPDNDLDRLIDRLFRVDGSRNRNSGGSGLGLSICNAIVQAHGGQLQTQHAGIGGLSVRIQLPIQEAA